MRPRIPPRLANSFAIIGFIAMIALILYVVLSTLGQAQPSATYPCTVTSSAVVLPKNNVITATTSLTATALLPEVRYVTGIIGLGSEVTLQIDHLSTYLGNTQQSAQTIVPFINGLPLKGVYPQCIDRAKNQLQFRLVRTNANKDVVDGIARTSLYDDNIMDLKHEVLISAGYENKEPFSVTYNEPRYFIVADFIWFFLWAAASIVVPILLLILAVRFHLLQILPTNDGLQEFLTEYQSLKIKTAYSLGLFQVAWWFIIIFISFLLLDFITWNINTITAGTVGLLGISVATAVGSVAINSSKQTDQQISEDLSAYKASIDGRFGELGTTAGLIILLRWLKLPLKPPVKNKKP